MSPGGAILRLSQSTRCVERWVTTIAFDFIARLLRGEPASRYEEAGRTFCEVGSRFCHGEAAASHARRGRAVLAEPEGRSAKRPHTRVSGAPSVELVRAKTRVSRG